MLLNKLKKLIEEEERKEVMWEVKELIKFLDKNRYALINYKDYSVILDIVRRIDEIKEELENE